MDYPTSMSGGYPHWLRDPRLQAVLDLVLSQIEMTALGLTNLDRDAARDQLAAARNSVLDQIQFHTTDLPAFAEDHDGEVALVAEFLLQRSFGRLLGMLDEGDAHDAEERR